jgi:hypothetical protein
MKKSLNVVILANSSQLELLSDSMIKKSLDTVIKTLNFVDNFILISSENIFGRINLTKLQENRKLITIQARNTQGALATLCLAAPKIKREEPILVVPTNSFVNNDVLEEFTTSMFDLGADVGILTMLSSNPIFSYARSNSIDNIIEILEKKVIGSQALTGHFYFKDLNLLLSCATWALKNNLTTDGLFYISSSLNYIIASGQKISAHLIDESSYRRLHLSRGFISINQLEESNE